MNPAPPPRIFCIPATDAPIVAVLRRGPSDWFHVGRWDVGAGAFEAGSWLHGTVYPQRCDLSPDGRWLAYFALKTPAPWAPGPTYIAISRLPWLQALAAWGTGGTWTHGVHFVGARDDWEVGEPDVGEVEPIRRRFGMRMTRAASFAVERRRGWSETADTPPRDEDDVWDERRSKITMEKSRPGDSPPARLTVTGSYAAFRDLHGTLRTEVRYELHTEGSAIHLDDVQWADWDAEGRLLVATVRGTLQIRELADDDSISVRAERDLARLTPDPSPPPAVAREW